MVQADYPIDHTNILVIMKYLLNGPRGPPIPDENGLFIPAPLGPLPPPPDIAAINGLTTEKDVYIMQL